MTALSHRIQNFIVRSRWLGGVTGSTCSAAMLYIAARFYKKVPARGKWDGFVFHFRGMDFPILKEIIQYGEYDFLAEALQGKDNPLVLDIGSHIGLFAVWALRTNPGARVLSVEASPETYRVVSRNAALAREEKGADWQVINRAAWRDETPVTFLNEGNGMGHHISRQGKVSVPGISFNALLEQVAADGRDIDCVKIDIEGGEEEFLSVDPALLKRVRHLAIELHPARCDAEKVRGFLADNFSHIEEITGRDCPKPLVYCKK